MCSHQLTHCELQASHSELSRNNESWRSLWFGRIFCPFPKIDPVHYTRIIAGTMVFWRFSFKLLPIEKYLRLAEVNCVHQLYNRQNQKKKFHFFSFIYISIWSSNTPQNYSQENLLIVKLVILDSSQSFRSVNDYRGRCVVYLRPITLSINIFKNRWKICCVSYASFSSNIDASLWLKLRFNHSISCPGILDLSLLGSVTEVSFYGR